MVRMVSAVAVSVIGAFLIGCGGFDQTQIIIHPDTTAAASTFDATLLNAFVYLDSSSTLSNRVERDSLHLLVGMPESWSVVEAKVTVVRDLNLTTLMAMAEDSIDEQTAEQMFEQYQAEAVAMQGDATLPNAISGMTIAAQNPEGNDDSVDVDDIEKWIGFSAPVAIVLEQGSKVDTMLPLDSMNELISGFDSTATIDPLLQSFIPDSIGMSMIPILIYLRIQAGSQEGIDTLYYFTKTGSMDIEANSTTNPLLSELNLDVGDMAYIPVTVINGEGVRSDRSLFTLSAVRVIADRSTGGVRIDLGNVHPQQTSIGIYSLAGNLIRALTPARVTIWDGTDERGSRVRCGSYLVRIATAGGSVARNIQIVR